MFSLDKFLALRVRRRGSLQALLLCAAVGLLSGCQHDMRDDFIENRLSALPADSQQVKPLIDATTGKPMGAPSPQVDIAQHYDMVSGAGTAPIANSYLPNYVKICDVYWKLNWIRKELLAGHVPHNLKEVMSDCQRELVTTIHDGNYNLGIESLKHLDEGVRHLRAAQILVEAQISEMDVPWSQGRTEVEYYVTNILYRRSNRFQTPIHAGSPQKPAPIGLPAVAPAFTAHGANASPARQEAIDTILHYASNYDASPETMARREWQIAITRINRLRDNLYLTGRQQNKDGDQTTISAGIASQADNRLGHDLFPDSTTSSPLGTSSSGESSNPFSSEPNGTAFSSSSHLPSTSVTPSSPQTQMTKEQRDELVGGVAGAPEGYSPP